MKRALHVPSTAFFIELSGPGDELESGRGRDDGPAFRARGIVCFYMREVRLYDLQAGDGSCLETFAKIIRRSRQHVESCRLIDGCHIAQETLASLIRVC